MNITVNGKAREIETNGDREIDLPALLALFEINPRLVAVAINGDVIPKGEYADAKVRAGDALEIVRMVGGGAT
jgi:sulfur carrier protein